MKWTAFARVFLVFAAAMAAGYLSLNMFVWMFLLGPLGLFRLLDKLGILSLDQFLEHGRVLRGSAFMATFIDLIVALLCLVAVAILCPPLRFRNWIFGLLALTMVLMNYALYSPAVVSVSLAWLLYQPTVFRFLTRRGSVRAKAGLAYFMVLGVVAYFSVGASALTMDRFYVWKDQSLFVGYKEFKPVAAIGDGDTGMRYLFRVSFLGIRESRATMARYSCTPFADHEVPEAERRERVSFESLIREKGTIWDGGDCS